jgi:5'-nucleotidase/UDP-sugar diphosphatase
LNGSLLLKDQQLGNNGSDFIKTVDGVEVGFFGITTQETAYKTNPNNISGVTFADPIQTSKKEVAKLKSDGAQVVVGIMHIGNDSSSDPTSDKIAQNVPGIDVIIDGHSHTLENKLVNNTLIAQTGSYNANVGKIDISVSGDKVLGATETLIPRAAIQTNYTPVPEVTALANQINDSQKSIFQTVVGRTNTALWGGTVNGTSVARLGETNLGDLVADSMIYGAKAQVKGTQFAKLPIVALQNGGGVRDSISTGFINRGQIIGVLPFGNILSLKVVTPKLLYEALENGVSKIAGVDSGTGVISGADGRFPQIAGMSIVYDPSKTPSNTDASKGPLVTGKRVLKIVLTNGKALNRNDTKTEIVLASNDFEIAGGDGYTMLAALKNIGEGDALDVLFEKYIAKLTHDGKGVFQVPSTSGRIAAISSYKYKHYAATVTVKNGDAPVANKSVSYSIDGEHAKKALTNANGELTISNLTSGPHSVMVGAGYLAGDVYVNNMIAGSTKVAVNLVNLDAKLAEAVSNLIAALPATITLNDEAAVKVARQAYNSLTSVQKVLVTNYSKLLGAEAAIKDQYAAKAMITLINKIPVQVTYRDAKTISDARKAYNALTTTQKGLVTNYDKLVAAEKVLAALPVHVKLNKTSAKLSVNTKLQLVAAVSPAYLTNKAVTWSSSNTAVATVDSKGKVTAKKAGTAIITVKSVTGSGTATCAITVVEPVITVKLSASNLTLKKGQRYTLLATVAPSSLSNKKVVWFSNNSSIASVDANGRIYAKKRGTAIIVAKSLTGGKTAVCVVQVK